MDDDGTSYCSPRCEVAVEVMKPYELQKSPWEGRSVTYHKDTQYSLKLYICVFLNDLFITITHRES